MSGWGERIIPMSSCLVCTSRLAATTGPPDGILRGPLAQGLKVELGVAKSGGWEGAQELRSYGCDYDGDAIQVQIPQEEKHVHPKNGQLKIQCVSMTSSYFEFYFNMYLLAICCTSRWPVEISRNS